MSNPWVAVNKRVPKRGELYQCYTTDGYIVTCILSLSGEWTLSVAGRYYGDLWGNNLDEKLHQRRRVTHWKLLPKPPKDAEKEVKFYK